MQFQNEKPIQVRRKASESGGHRTVGEQSLQASAGFKHQLLQLRGLGCESSCRTGESIFARELLLEYTSIGLLQASQLNVFFENLEINFMPSPKAPSLLFAGASYKPNCEGKRTNNTACLLQYCRRSHKDYHGDNGCSSFPLLRTTNTANIQGAASFCLTSF